MKACLKKCCNKHSTDSNKGPNVAVFIQQERQNFPAANNDIFDPKPNPIHPHVLS